MVVEAMLFACLFFSRCCCLPRSVCAQTARQVRGKQQHGPVANSPSSEAEDMAVVDSEVDVDALADGMPGSSSGSEQQEQQE